MTLRWRLQIVALARVAPRADPLALAAVQAMSLAFVVVRLPLEEVVAEAPLALFTEPSATATPAAPEISNTIMPGLITPPAVVKFTVTLVTAAELAT